MQRILIVDDEYLGRKYLADLIAEFWPGERIVEQASHAKEALELLAANKADVLFLDIKMPGTNGFQLLEALDDSIDTKVVFVTAYKQYAFDAIKARAFDYLLKPVDRTEFSLLVQRLTIKNRETIPEPEPVPEKPQEQKITIRHSTGFRIISFNEIVCLKASNNYTSIVLTDNSVILVSKTMKDFEDKLKEPLFFRTHKSYMINMDYFNKFSRTKGLLLKNGDTIPVSRNRLPHFMDLIKKLTFV